MARSENWSSRWRKKQMNQPIENLKMEWNRSKEVNHIKDNDKHLGIENVVENQRLFQRLF